MSLKCRTVISLTLCTKIVIRGGDAMPYQEVKVYSDGGHYIGIPHTTRPAPKRRPQIEEEDIEIDGKPVLPDAEPVKNVEELPFEETTSPDTETSGIESNGGASQEVKEDNAKQERKITRKELFEMFYDETRDLSKVQRKKAIIDKMRPYFKSDATTKEYVERNMERKFRNLIYRRIRMVRKANLHDFNYFVTFTFDDRKHNEDSFRKKLLNCLSLLSSRKGWRYIGVWERSPEKHRLHFHGIFIIPDGTMPGEMVDVNDYSLKSHKRQITHQNTYFLQKFGRNDFEEIESKIMMGSALSYLLKYLEKTGEKIVYSRGLPQFFITDVEDDDVVCKIGADESKLLLFDNFICWDEGEYIGRVSPETISKLRKSN